eukprot:TRINITY_DN32213_c0_g1_i1.p1 TRINITY_DN32213_c0_g1~~TRINITY_DN32213_c0_g1_i1.p1  ORF type:complete len:173 (+),score=32.08 TRINITY_DN32213_c0_g1_i1:215-733(+)
MFVLRKAASVVDVRKCSTSPETSPTISSVCPTETPAGDEAADYLYDSFSDDEYEHDETLKVTPFATIRCYKTEVQHWHSVGQRLLHAFQQVADGDSSEDELELPQKSPSMQPSTITNKNWQSVGKRVALIFQSVIDDEEEDDGIEYSATSHVLHCHGSLRRSALRRRSPKRG